MLTQLEFQSRGHLHIFRYDNPIDMAHELIRLANDKASMVDWISASVLAAQISPEALLLVDRHVKRIHKGV